MQKRPEHLEAEIASISDEIDNLKLENSVFQKFVEKKTIELGNDEESKGKKKNKKTNAALLTSEQKYDISNVVHDDLLQEIENHRKSSEKMIDTLRSVLEETEIRINELKRDAYEFKRDVVVGAENVRTGKIMAEKVARYFEDKVKKVDAVIEKLRLKNASLKSQISKVESQLAQKEEVGDVLHYIDFHQLQIENKQYIAKIEERNDELLNVKVTTGKSIQALNDLKRTLNERLDECTWLQNEIALKHQQVEKLGKERGAVSKEVNGEVRQRDRLKQAIEEAAMSSMPHVEDYIMQKKELYELQSQLKNWQKKVDIMEMAAKRTRALTQGRK